MAKPKPRILEVQPLAEHELALAEARRILGPFNRKDKDNIPDCCSSHARDARELRDAAITFFKRFPK